MKSLTVVYLSITLALIFAPSLFAQDVQTGLVSYWNFDEGTGDIINDIVGNNDGTINGAPTWVNGIIGGGLEFNGNNNYIDCGADVSLDITETLTIAAWVKVAAFGNWDGVVTKGVNSGPYAMQLWGKWLCRFNQGWFISWQRYNRCSIVSNQAKKEQKKSREVSKYPRLAGVPL